mgnify:CR=1 FL=1
MEVKRFMHQLIDAVEYLHALRVIHRDLKMGNIFLDETMNLKVGDLGLAAKLHFNDERKRTMCGTPNYIAPEILTGGDGHSYEVDTWSLGVIIYTLLFGNPPFETSDVKTTYRKIKQNNYSFPENSKVSPQAKSLVSCILALEPS